jgi:hypothetical protein
VLVRTHAFILPEAHEQFAATQVTDVPASKASVKVKFATKGADAQESLCAQPKPRIETNGNGVPRLKTNLAAAHPEKPVLNNDFIRHKIPSRGTLQCLPAWSD